MHSGICVQHKMHVLLPYSFEGNEKKVDMSDYEIRRPSHVSDVANIVNRMLCLHAKVRPFKIKSLPHNFWKFNANNHYPWSK